MILHMLIAMMAGWVQRHQQQVITYLQEENESMEMLEIRPRQAPLRLPCQDTMA